MIAKQPTFDRPPSPRENPLPKSSKPSFKKNNRYEELLKGNKTLTNKVFELQLKLGEYEQEIIRLRKQIHLLEANEKFYVNENYMLRNKLKESPLGDLNRLMDLLG